MILFTLISHWCVATLKFPKPECQIISLKEIKFRVSLFVTQMLVHFFSSLSFLTFHFTFSSFVGQYCALLEFDSVNYSNSTISHIHAYWSSAVIWHSFSGVRESLSSGSCLGRTRGLHSRQVFQVTEFARAGTQSSAEGAPLLTVIFPTGLQTSTEVLPKATESAPEMIPDKAIEHRVNGRVREAQA